MRVNLRINGVGFELGEQLDTGKLGQARCKKVGFLQRRLIRAQPSQRVFFAKNPVLVCFHDDAFEMKPQLELRPDTDRMWGTSAYLFYGSQLIRVTLQLIGSVSESAAAAEHFSLLTDAALGAASSIGGSASDSSWPLENSRLVCERAVSGKHVFFHWLYAEEREAHGA